MPTVNPPRRVGIDEKLAALRLQLMAGDVAKRFGLRMRERRLELKLTQKQVARRMPSGGEDGPVDAQRISDWERGYNEPSDRYKLELVQALDVSDVSYFYEDPEQPDVLEALSGNGNGNGTTDVAAQLAAMEGRLAAIERSVGMIEESLATIATARAVVVSRRTLQQLRAELPGEDRRQAG